MLVKFVTQCGCFQYREIGFYKDISYGFEYKIALPENPAVSIYDNGVYEHVSVRYRSFVFKGKKDPDRYI